VRLFLLGVIALALSGQDVPKRDRPQFVWQGQVDGRVILHLAGKRLTVQVDDGAPVERQKFHFSDALPQTGQNVRVDVLEGRGYVHVIDQPNVENNYTLAVEIEDRQPGSSFYSIALNWDTSNNAFEGGEGKKDRVSWAGRVDEEATVSCRARVCTSAVERGAPVADEKFKFSRPMPAREVEVRLEDPEGRGEIHLLDQPRRENNYTARVEVRDPLPGAGEYSFELVWIRATARELKEAAAVPETASRGFVWTGSVAGGVRVTLKGGASFSEALAGGGVRGEHGEILRPLPERADLMPTVEKLRGRGRVAVIEPPSEKNNYSLVFEIDDSGPGADDYQVEVAW
jgi:hypothetical protein